MTEQEAMKMYLNGFAAGLRSFLNLKLDGTDANSSAVEAFDRDWKRWVDGTLTMPSILEAFNDCMAQPAATSLTTCTNTTNIANAAMADGIMPDAILSTLG